MAYLAHISEDGTREQSLKEHLTNTAEMAGKYAAEFGNSEWGYFCGLMHDIGKYSKAFQERLHGSEKRVDHSTAGALEAKGRKVFLAAYCIAGHHAGLPDGGAMTDAEGKTLYARMKKKIPDYSEFAEEIKIPKVSAPKLQMSTRAFYSASFFVRMIYSCLVDADYLDTEYFMRQTGREYEYQHMDDLYCKLLDYITPWLNMETADSFNSRRTSILKACLRKGEETQGIYELTVPTGGGKTISSMAFALRQAVTHGLNRVIYVIPYTSIIEQTAKVFQTIFGAGQVLEHHSHVEYGDGEELNKKQLASENWDAPIVVTTNVQFFESLYASKSSKCRKLHNIAKSVIIFDEAQMLPNDYLKPCVSGINELVLNYGCTAVMCTATQPSLNELYLPEVYRGEICPKVNEQYEAFRRVQLVYDGELMLEKLKSRLSEEHQALCILNTRKNVQNLYRMLEPETGIFHLSTYMYPEHRKLQLETIRQQLREGKRCIVIATSLVEAGVDLDFQSVYRELAGLDSIIQAAGRCNREGRNDIERSITHIFSLSKEEQRYNTVIKQAVAVTEQIIREYEDVASPGAIKEYFNRLHDIKGDALDKYDIVRQLDLIGRDCSIPYRTVSEQFHIIQENTKAILIVRNDKAAELEQKLRFGERTRKLMREISHYTVNVYEQIFERLNAVGALEIVDEEISILRNDELYTEEVGLYVGMEIGDGIFF